MGNGFKMGGAGALLNFQIIGGTVQPETAAENTLWLSTDTAINGWTLSASAPENPPEGMVWIPTRNTTGSGFNVLKNDTIIIVPAMGRQYIGGAWVNKDTRLYRNGAWEEVGLAELYLFEVGDPCEDVTGGWTQSLLEGYGNNVTMDAQNASGLLIQASADTSYGSIVHTAERIDLTDRKTIEATVNIVKYFYDLHMAVYDILGTSEAKIAISESGTVSLDISGLIPGSYYVGFYAANPWLERRDSIAAVKQLKAL